MIPKEPGQAAYEVWLQSNEDQGIGADDWYALDEENKVAWAAVEHEVSRWEPTE